MWLKKNPPDSENDVLQLSGAEVDSKLITSICNDI